MKPCARERGVIASVVPSGSSPSIARRMRAKSSLEGLNTTKWTPAAGPAAARWAGITHEPQLDHRHPYLALQHELCISCGRCVRACDEVQGAFALTAVGRGFHANIAAGLGAGFAESSCVSCGACADTCPTDAISERLLFDLAAAPDHRGAAR